MTFWLVLLTIVEVVCALLLVLLVLLQRSKDEGLGMAFGNAMGESLFGAQATTILTKATVILAVVFLVNTVVIDRLYSHGTRTSSGSVMDNVTGNAALPPPVEAAPVTPTPEAATPAPEAGPAPAFNLQPSPAAPAPAAPAAAVPPAAPAAAVPATPVPQT